MVEKIQIRLRLNEAKKPDILLKKAQEFLSLSPQEINAVKILRKSIDARKPTIYIHYKLAVYIGESPEKETYSFSYKDVSNAPPVHIVGFGPAGMFAALRLIELGYKPVIFERGKDVRKRRRDLRLINQSRIVNENSNYCFGEGGAGTYSDGKLYTRSLKRGDVRRIFENLVYHGAPPQILIDAHPHIGTDKLPGVIQNIRTTILQYGGEIHFESRLTDLNIKNNKIHSIIINNQNEIAINKLILATGHSARDIYYLLDRHQISLLPKSFAMGVRVEHPQELIDSIQYHCPIGQKDEILPPASYSLVHQIGDRGVYSFCMCPGGFIVPAATSPGEVVVNGMSPSLRNNTFANSGIVVEINIDKDLAKYEKYGVFKGLEFQKELEHLAFVAGGKNLSAPAQKLTDFVEGRLSTNLNPTSYQPGITPAPLHSILPKIIGRKLRKAFKNYGQKMPGFYTEIANVIGVESRTSSPLKIPRTNAYHHPKITNLFPAGEGAGYAGGIVSAAMDGEKIAENISK
jgi:uncharacterized FAD-dependent dehydrogenase